jgi:hypothetical protein
MAHKSPTEVRPASIRIFGRTYSITYVPSELFAS